MAAFIERQPSDGADDADQAARYAEMFGPFQVDQAVRQALHFCWMLLPKDRKNLDEVERQFRRVVDRALKDLREDAEAFGLSK